MASVYTSDLIETQTYQLIYEFGNGPSAGAGFTDHGPIQDININVPFKVRKMVFKPLNLYVATGNGGNAQDPAQPINPNNGGDVGPGVAAIRDQPDLMFCNLYDVNKAIGYTGYYNIIPSLNGLNPSNPAASIGYFNQPVHDVTFSVRNLMNINGSYKFYLYNSASQCYYATSPFTGIITITVEYHGY